MLSPLEKDTEKLLKAVRRQKEAPTSGDIFVVTDRIVKSARDVIVHSRKEGIGIVDVFRAIKDGNEDIDTEISRAFIGGMKLDRLDSMQHPNKPQDEEIPHLF